MSDTVMQEATAQKLISVMEKLLIELEEHRVTANKIDQDDKESLDYEVELFYTQMCIQSSGKSFLLEPLGKSVAFWRALEQKLTKNNWCILKSDIGWVIVDHRKSLTPAREDG